MKTKGKKVALLGFTLALLTLGSPGTTFRSALAQQGRPSQVPSGGVVAGISTTRQVASALRSSPAQPVPQWREYSPTTLPDYASLLAEQAILMNQCGGKFSRVEGLNLDEFPVDIQKLLATRRFKNAYEVKVPSSGSCATDDSRFVKFDYQNSVTGQNSTCLELQNTIRVDALPAPYGSGVVTPGICQQAHTNFYVCCDR